MIYDMSFLACKINRGKRGFFCTEWVFEGVLPRGAASSPHCSSSHQLVSLPSSRAADCFSNCGLTNAGRKTHRQMTVLPPVHYF